MNSITKFSMLMFFLAAEIVSAQNREIKFEDGKWPSILEKSKTENKMIYLDCYASWCGPCKWMAKNVFTNDTVADFYNANFINVEMDMEKGEGIELSKKYGLRAYPTMLYLNAAGEVIHRSCGSSSVQSFVNTGKDALSPDKQLATFTRKFNNGNTDAASATHYFSMLESGCQSYNAELNNYFSFQKESDFSNSNNWKIIYHFVNDYSSPEFIFLEKNADAFQKLYGMDSVQGKLNSVYSTGLQLALRKKDDAAFEMLKLKLKESGTAGAEKIIMEADLNNFVKKADWKNYAVMASAYADKYLKDDANTLNAISWTFYENVSDKGLLEKASSWAKRSTELEDIYANNDTYAAVLYKLGKKDEAKRTAQKAIDLAKKSGEDAAETEALLKKINKLKDPKPSLK